VHCTTLGTLDICEAGAIGVDDDGVISFVERDVKFDELDTVVKKHGWEESKVVRIYDSGFYFPGFIGTFENWKTQKSSPHEGKAKNGLWNHEI